MKRFLFMLSVAFLVVTVFSAIAFGLYKVSVNSMLNVCQVE